MEDPVGKHGEKKELKKAQKMKKKKKKKDKKTKNLRDQKEVDEVPTFAGDGVKKANPSAGGHAAGPETLAGDEVAVTLGSKTREPQKARREARREHKRKRQCVGTTADEAGARSVGVEVDERPASRAARAAPAADDGQKKVGGMEDKEDGGKAGKRRKKNKRKASRSPDASGKAPDPTPARSVHVAVPCPGNAGHTKRHVEETEPESGGSEDRDDSDDDGVAEEALQGVFHGMDMFLLKPSTGDVFSPERDEDGELVRVGSWDAAAKAVVLDPVDIGAPKAPSASDGSASAGDAGSTTHTGLESGGCSAAGSPGGSDETVARHAFPVDPDDHCETPLEAYVDIQPVLQRVADRLGKSRHELVVYDPYFCAGAVKRNLASCGFPNVINRNEDFYKAIADGNVPIYDVLVTNPPYSESHIHRIVDFCVQSGKPWLLLVPNYVYMKDYYKDACARGVAGKSIVPFYLCPAIRYTYKTPTGFRNLKSKQRKTAPFVSFWFCHLGRHSGAVVQSWFTSPPTYPAAHTPPTLARSSAQLPQAMKDSNDPTRKRLRKKQREAAKRRASGGAL